MFHTSMSEAVATVASVSDSEVVFGFQDNSKSFLLVSLLLFNISLDHPTAHDTFALAHVSAIIRLTLGTSEQPAGYGLLSSRERHVGRLSQRQSQRNRDFRYKLAQQGGNRVPKSSNKATQKDPD